MPKCWIVSGLAVFSTLVTASFAQAQQAPFCYAPCVITLHGRVMEKQVDLNDPVMHFKAYFLQLEKPIAVLEDSQFLAAQHVERVQWRLPGHNLHRLVGKCVVVTGLLTGQLNIQDVTDVVLNADTATPCR